MPRLLLLTLCAFIASAVLGWFAFQSPWNGTDMAIVISDHPVVLRTKAQTTKKATASISRSSSMESEAAEQQELTARDTPAPSSSLLSLNGSVLGRETLQPLAHHTIKLSSMVPDRDGSLETQTDQEGRFEFTIPATIGSIGELAQITVRTPDERRDLHVEVVQLQPHIPVYVPESTHLTGWLSTPAQDNLDGLKIRIDEVGPVNSRYFLGETQTGVGGYFTLAARPHDWAEGVSIAVFRDGVPLGFGKAPLSELQSVAGARVTLNTRTVTFQVRGAQSIPLPKAKILVGPVNPEVDNWSGELITDQDGRAASTLPEGPYEYIVHQAGYQPHQSITTGSDLEEIFLELDLQPGSEEPLTVSGTVETPGGDPIPDAVVTIKMSTQNPELGFRVVNIKAITSPSGAFKAEIPRRADYAVVAYHRDLGLSPIGTVALPTDGRQLRVIIGPKSPVEVILKGDILTMPSFDGYLEYFIRDVERNRTLHRTWRRPPYLSPPLPTGRYEVMVRCPALNLFGSASVSIPDEGNDLLPAPIDLQLPPLAVGHVLDRDGVPVAGATVSVSAADLSMGYPLDWQNTTTDSSGWYEAPAIGREVGQLVELVVSSASSQVLRESFQLGSDPANLVVADALDSLSDQGKQ